MGSQQSSTQTPQPIMKESTSPEARPPPKQPAHVEGGKNKEPLTGFALVKRQCRRKEKAYSKCHAAWYGASFVSGKNIERDEKCDDLFEEYRLCVLRGMKRQREKRGLPPPKEGSMLAELNDDDDEDE
mmetsp:Transcript_266/g.647  ORF Transcript_266/g.647 Transcript_266/m.647 type:complete len:128 (-) Transcript_266:258-641(-)